MMARKGILARVVAAARCMAGRCAPQPESVMAAMSGDAVHVWTLSLCPRCGKGSLEVRVLGEMSGPPLASAAVDRESSALARKALEAGAVSVEEGEIRY